MAGVDSTHPMQVHKTVDKFTSFLLRYPKTSGHRGDVIVTIRGRFISPLFFLQYSNERTRENFPYTQGYIISAGTAQTYSNTMRPYTLRRYDLWCCSIFSSWLRNRGDHLGLCSRKHTETQTLKKNDVKNHINVHKNHAEKKQLPRILRIEIVVTGFFAVDCMSEWPLVHSLFNPASSWTSTILF